LVRLDKEPEEVSRDVEMGVLSRIHGLEAFVATTEPGTFDARYERLPSQMREHVREFGANNIEVFDDLIESSKRDGTYALGWVAYRDWVNRQPWVEEARVQARARREREARIDFAALGRQMRGQAAILSALRVKIHNAPTEEERQALLAEADRLEAEFEEANWGRRN
jgi:hypothetical protein